MSHAAISNSHCPARASRPNLVKRAFDLIRQRQSLAKLDCHALNDIGISRSEAETEAARPFWDAPETWRK